jgi:hypothetical protein
MEADTLHPRLTPIRSLVSAIFALAFAALAPPVHADCAVAGPPAEALPTAAIAFVGEVVGVTGPMATFEVREVWAGGDLAQIVEVRGLSDDGANPQALGEDDRTWTLGTTYLVLPYADGGLLRDSICSATTEWTDDLAALRPADARLVASSSGQDPSIPVPALVIGAAVVFLAGMSLLAFRRSHP